MKSFDIKEGYGFLIVWISEDDSTKKT
jgi:hypothetical protein